MDMYSTLKDEFLFKHNDEWKKFKNNYMSENLNRFLKNLHAHKDEKFIRMMMKGLELYNEFKDANHNPLACSWKSFGSEIKFSISYEFFEYPIFECADLEDEVKYSFFKYVISIYTYLYAKEKGLNYYFEPRIDKDDLSNCECILCNIIKENKPMYIELIDESLIKFGE